MIIDLHIHSISFRRKINRCRKYLKKQKPETSDFWRLQITIQSAAKHQASTLVEKRSTSGYITGVELNVTFSHPKYHEGKTVSLDFLGYQFDADNEALGSKLIADGKISRGKSSKNSQQSK